MNDTNEVSKSVKLVVSTVGRAVSSCSSYEQSDSINTEVLTLMLKVAKDLALLSPTYMHFYSTMVDHRDEDVEQFLIDSKNPSLIVSYVKNAFGGKRWYEVEDIILTDFEFVLEYVKEVIKGRWDRAEALCEESPFWKIKYEQYIKTLEQANG